MKSLKCFSIFLFLLPVFANPIMIFHLNELLIDFDDTSNWKLELSTEMLDNLDGYYLTTTSDTAELKSISLSDRQYIIITKDSLLSPLHINPNGDILEFHNPDGYSYDQIAFGPVDLAEIDAPKRNMSISRYNTYFPEWQEYYLYFDTSPTLGSHNDSTGATGGWQGYVYNASGAPLDSVQVVYHHYYEPPDYHEVTSCIYTNVSGYFIFENLAHRNCIEFRKEGYFKKDTTCQIWPDSINTTSISLIKDVSPIDTKNSFPLNTIKLLQNYPNPFNAQTQFQFYLPLNDFVELDIFDLSGRMVKRIVSAYKTHGYHKISWNAGGIASGLYIYQLRTSEILLTKKCLLLK